jgi:hypothetical protein
MNELFKRDLVYPSDEVGAFEELIGVATHVGQANGDNETRVEVTTLEHGIFTAYARNYPPLVGSTCKIRVYRSGGGFYPDHRVMSWSRPERKICDRSP